MIDRDFYTILGVDRSCTGAEVKRAYQELAKVYHPDRYHYSSEESGRRASERFKDISAAYRVLSSPPKRAAYDAMRRREGGRRSSVREARVRENFSSGSVFEDLFSSVFSNLGGEGASARPVRRPVRGKDVEVEVSMSFEEAVRGCVKTLVIGGCKLKVRFQEGLDEGDILRLQGRGEPGREGGDNGDGFVKIASITAHDIFQRQGRNIMVEVPISLKEAVLGSLVSVPTIWGMVKVQTPPNLERNTSLRVKGKGIRTRKGTGDQYVQLTIQLPRKNLELKKFLISWQESKAFLRIEQYPSIIK